MSRRDPHAGDSGSDDVDGYGSLFDAHPDDDHAGDEHGAPEHGGVATSTRAVRSTRSQGHRARRSRAGWVVALAIVVVLVLLVWLVVLPVYRHFTPQDYDGAGSGAVTVTVQANDGASDIADELHRKGVVASTTAFVDAAEDDSRSRSIQPGTYRLRSHMSGAAALRLILTPSARVDDDVVVTEGSTMLDVVTRMTAAPCSAGDGASAKCGPGFSEAAVRAALRNVASLGVPSDFRVAGAAPSSVEGLLYPATYYFPETERPADALQQMITKFAEQLRSTDFTSSAKRNGFTPYQQLIAASIAQSEAKYPADMAKVVRVIMNRIASRTPLRIDATSAYAAKLEGQDPTKIIYDSIDSPFNTYTHSGLPPTPISNPGSEALAGAASPAAGNWLFYVNSDAAGHLFFTSSEKAFTAAVEKCRTHHWGCG